MELNIEIVEKNLRRFVFGEAAPAYLEPEFNALLVAIRSLSAHETNQIGSKALTAMLDRMAAGMEAEKALKIMRAGGNNLFYN